MATKRVCDRSGREIPHPRRPEDGEHDLGIHVPWLPELDGARFTDLSNEDRIQVVRYLGNVFRRSGKDDMAVLLASAIGTDGQPLVKPADGEAPPPAAPPAQETLLQPPPATPPVEPAAPPVEEPDDDEPETPASEPAAAAPADPKPPPAPPEDVVPREKWAEMGLPDDAKDGDTIEARYPPPSGPKAWWFFLDGQWRGPRATRVRAVRSYEAIQADRAEHRRGSQAAVP